MKKIAFSILSLATVGVITWSCSKSFLDRKPLGGLDATTLANKNGVEALLVGAYSVLDGFINGGGIFLGGWESSGTNWVYGSVVGGDAHKGPTLVISQTLTLLKHLRQHQPITTSGSNITWFMKVLPGVIVF